MFRKCKKLITDFLLCNLRKSTYFYLLILLLFISGNYFFLLYGLPSVRNISTEDESIDINDWVVKNQDNKNRGNNEDADHFKEFIVTESPPSKNIISSKENNLKNDLNLLDTVDQMVEVTVETKNEDNLKSNDQKPKIIILVIACNRPTVGRCLDRIFKYKPADISVVVSQDCGGEIETANVIKSYGNQLTHIIQPEVGDVKNVPLNMVRFMGYYKISRHYKWALTTVFDRWKDVGSVIIVEDDIDIGKQIFDL